MISAILLAALFQAPAAEEAPEEIVVTANRRGKCRVQLEDRTLSRAQLAARAKIWAANGTPVRVISPAGAGYACMAKIAFRLGDHGVRLIEFVERQE